MHRAFHPRQQELAHSPPVTWEEAPDLHTRTREFLATATAGQETEAQRGTGLQKVRWVSERPQLPGDSLDKVLSTTPRGLLDPRELSKQTVKGSSAPFFYPSASLPSSLPTLLSPAWVWPGRVRTRRWARRLSQGEGSSNGFSSVFLFLLPFLFAFIILSYLPPPGCQIKLTVSLVLYFLKPILGFSLVYLYF